MSLKRMMLGPILLAATTGPYLAMDESWQEWAQERTQSVIGSGTSSAEPSGALSGWDGSSGLPAASVAGSGTGTTDPAVAPVTNLQQAIRFDVAPGWVFAHWPRVSNLRGSDGAFGMRVPLITGTRPDDLTGSLTYYFDQRQQVRRISFHGYTGDPARLIDLGVRYLRLQPEPRLGPGMYLQRWNGEPTSALRVSPAPVARSDDPHSRFIVQMEINRPTDRFELSPEFQELIRYSTHTQGR